MMRLLLTGAAVLCCTFLCYAQHNSPQFTTSFKSPADSMRVHVLLSLADKASAESFDDAMELAVQAFDLTKANIGSADHPLADSCLIFIGALKSQTGDVKGGLADIDSALSMAHRLWPDGHPILIDQYYFKAQALQAGDDYTSALGAIKQAVHLIERFNYTDSVQYMMTYFYGGFLSVSLGDTKGAEPFFSRSLDLMRATPAVDSSDLADLIYTVAWYYQNSPNQEPAGALFAEALEMYRRDSTVEASRLLDCMESAAAHHEQAGRFSEARNLYEEAEQLYRSTPNPNATAFGNFLRKMGDFYARYGLYDKAEPLLFEAYDLAVKRRKLGRDNKMWTVSSIATYYNLRGMHAEAEPYFLDAMKLAREIHSEESMQYGMTVNNLGSFYLDRGRYKEASRLLEEAIQKIDAAGPLWHLITTASINNLAIAQDYLGNVYKAESLYVAGYNRVVKEHPEISDNRALAENNIGMFYLERGDYTSAEPYLRRSVSLYRQIYADKPHRNLATVIHNKARLFEMLGKTDSADILFAEALELRRRMFSIPNPDLLKSLWQYGEFLSGRDRVDEAEALFDEGIEGIAERMTESFAFESEGNQLDFMKNILQPGLSAFSRFALKHGPGDRQIPGVFLDALLKLKGAVANESMRRSAEMHKNSQVLELNNRLTVVREQQAALASRQASPDLTTAREALSQKADSIDAALRKLDREYDKLLKQRDADWKDVQRVLKPGEALVEYVVVAEHRKSKATLDAPHIYGAVVLRNSGRPEIVNICKEGQLRPFLAAPVAPRNRDSYVTNPERGNELYSIVWRPLETHLDGINRVYISADGLLYRVAFSALCTQTAPPVFLEERYDIRYLSGGRQLLARDARYSVRREHTNTLFALIGAPDYAALPEDAGTGNRYRRGWDPLPGTKNEIDGIAQTCQAYDVPIESITGAEAREDSVKALGNAAPRAIHIATHGFFFPEVELESAAIARTRSSSRGASQLRVIQNPMLRSGLIFSGANAVWSGEIPSTGSNDGILTALEVSRMNLIGTELVTLSACETGLGDVRNGEGIFGLQRAFQVAGAECILMSLWKVADEPTAEMMQLFYEQWLSGKTKQEAFTAARKTIRGKYASPFVWAAFVMVGE